MRVLVTGGAGYIGSVIVEELANAGHTPIVYDSLVKGRPAALAANVSLIEGDVTDTERLQRAIVEYQADAIIHMAALIEVGLSIADPIRFFDNNVGGSLSVLTAMRATGVRKLVFSSTAALYGDADQLPLTEDTPTIPTNPYGQSKLMVEQIMRWVAPAHDLICTSLRYFNAAGATERNGEQHDPETHLIPLALSAAAAGSPFELYGVDYPTADGSAIRDYIHVIDLAQAHIAALSRDQPGLRIYNVGVGVGYSNRQVLDAIRAVTGHPLEIIERPRRPGDQVATVASAARISAELGWQPHHTDLHTIIASAWAWRQSHPHGYPLAPPSAS